MRTFKIICLVLLIVLAAIVAFQNAAVMELKFLFWSVSMSACLMLLTVLCVGIAVGLLFPFLTVRRKSRTGKVELA
jgi:lipopolysaccharide assembly protein A